jgi:hypothetical protein
VISSSLLNEVVSAVVLHVVKPPSTALECCCVLCVDSLTEAEEEEGGEGEEAGREKACVCDVAEVLRRESKGLPVRTPPSASSTLSQVLAVMKTNKVKIRKRALE